MSVEWETLINKEITSRAFTNTVTFRHWEGDAYVHREYICILLLDLCLLAEYAPVYFQADELLHRHSHQPRRNATEVCTPAFQIKSNDLKVAWFSTQITLLCWICVSVQTKQYPQKHAHILPLVVMGIISSSSRGGMLDTMFFCFSPYKSIVLMLSYRRTWLNDVSLKERLRPFSTTAIFSKTTVF